MFTPVVSIHCIIIFCSIFLLIGMSYTVHCVWSIYQSKGFPDTTKTLDIFTYCMCTLYGDKDKVTIEELESRILINHVIYSFTLVIDVFENVNVA